jgi:XapX domain-containing protein
VFVKTYVIALGVGLLVAVIYSLLNVRSPAPPVVALVGLLGILVGEQVIPVGKQMLAGTSLGAGWQQLRYTQHLFGALPAVITPKVPKPPWSPTPGSPDHDRPGRAHS